MDGNDPNDSLDQCGARICKNLGIKTPLTLTDRVRVALDLGYIDAKDMVYMKETLGYPLDMYVFKMRKHFPRRNLKIDYSGLRHELLMLGTKESAVASQLEELMLIDREWDSLEKGK